MALLDKLLDPRKGLFAPAEIDLAPLVATKLEAAMKEDGNDAGMDALVAFLNESPERHGGEVASALRRTLKQSLSVKLQLRALKAIDVLIRRGPQKFREILVLKEVISDITCAVLSRKWHESVVDCVLTHVQDWVDVTKLAIYRDTYRTLKNAGFMFPRPDEDDLAQEAAAKTAIAGANRAAQVASGDALPLDAAELQAKLAEVEARTREHVTDAISQGVDYAYERKRERKTMAATPGGYMAVPDSYSAPSLIYASPAANVRVHGQAAAEEAGATPTKSEAATPTGAEHGSLDWGEGADAKSVRSNPVTPTLTASRSSARLSSWTTPPWLRTCRSWRRTSTSC